MTTLYVDDFKLGLDVRKSVLTAAAGSLQRLENCVITPGGEIEKRKAFVPICNLPAGASQGLYAGTIQGSGGTYLYTFGMAMGIPVNTTALYPNIAGVVGGPSVYMYSLGANALDATTPAALQRIKGVQEYGTGQFFVTAPVTSNGPPGPAINTRNWWLGNQVASYVGVAPLVSGQKMYRLNQGVIYFSGVGDPSVTNPLNPSGTGPNTVNPGAGFIDTTQLDNQTKNLIGMEAYYKQVAVFSNQACLLFNFDPNAANNVLSQILRIGALSNSSILQFGNGDVLFLSPSGVRSLRVVNVSLAAGVTDVGSPIDKAIQAAILADPDQGSFAQAIVEQATGRYWLAIGSTIYVLSYWPSSHINAWSTFTMPGRVDGLAAANGNLYARVGDTIYQYGGTTNLTYDNTVATVQTPLMGANTPTLRKKAISLGASVQGNWAMSVCMDSDNPTVFELAANLTKATYGQSTIPFAGYGTHVGFQFTTSDAGPSRLGAINVRFEKSDET